MQASQELDTIPAILRNNADQSGDSTALIYNYNKITYETLHELVLNASCGLSKLGIRSGDRVAVWLANKPAYKEL